MVQPLYLGLDLGTSGVRAIVADVAGRVAASHASAFPHGTDVATPGGHEQHPEGWWIATCEVLHRVVDTLHRNLGAAGVESLAAMAADGTSGTLVCLDRMGKPLRPALLYNDPRGGDAAAELNALAGDWTATGGRFTTAHALSKLAWLAKQEPETFTPTAYAIHQADFIVGRLTGHLHLTDSSNALKTGFDLDAERWPSWLERLPHLRERLPEVVAPGSLVGRVLPSAAAATGLPVGLAVVAGASDGTAACIASGLHSVGDYNTTLGTTLVFKSLSTKRVVDPSGKIYCHKLPGGWWLPGAASNTGSEWISRHFAGADLAALDRQAASQWPTEIVAYPLAREGERFPFAHSQAHGFVEPEVADPATRFAACLQGTALVERLAYDVLDAALGHSGGAVFTTGGGSSSDVWCQCRADVTGRRLQRPAVPESAFGMAVLAAAGATATPLAEGIRSMVRLEREFLPSARRREAYDRLYERFRAELARRGWL